jgi:hypothetical protein
MQRSGDRRISDGKLKRVVVRRMAAPFFVWAIPAVATASDPISIRSDAACMDARSRPAG